MYVCTHPQLHTHNQLNVCIFVFQKYKATIYNNNQSLLINHFLYARPYVSFIPILLFNPHLILISPILQTKNSPQVKMISQGHGPHRC